MQRVEMLFLVAVSFFMFAVGYRLLAVQPAQAQAGSAVTGFASTPIASCDAGPGEIDCALLERTVADLRREKDVVAPNDRGRGPQPTQRRLPGDVPVRSPLDGDVAIWRNPVGRRSTPLRPVGCAEEVGGEKYGGDSLHITT